MICPNCGSSELKEVDYDKTKQDIKYECENCHKKLILGNAPLNIKKDDDGI